MDHFVVTGSPSLYVQCPHCGMFVNHLTTEHFRSQFCLRQTERRARIFSSRQCLATANESIPFYIGRNPIKFVSDFRYLGRILSKDDSDDKAAYVRMQEAKHVWGRFSYLLRQDGASVETMGRFY